MEAYSFNPIQELKERTQNVELDSDLNAELTRDSIRQLPFLNELPYEAGTQASLLAAYYETFYWTSRGVWVTSFLLWDPELEAAAQFRWKHNRPRSSATVANHRNVTISKLRNLLGSLDLSLGNTYEKAREVLRELQTPRGVVLLYNTLYGEDDPESQVVVDILNDSLRGLGCTVKTQFTRGDTAGVVFADFYGVTPFAPLPSNMSPNELQTLLNEAVGVDVF
jgi:hypothetical protein